MTPQRFPIFSTLFVAIAVCVMAALGVWQLDRKGEKETQLAQLAANLDRPAIAFPKLGPIDEALLFRQSSVTCLSVEGWTVKAGGGTDGVTGFRYIAQCATGVEGPGVPVVIGVAPRPDLKPEWSGGTVKGWIVLAGEESGLLARLMGQDAPTSAMLIANGGQAGLQTPAIPSIDTVPNNHFAYAVQWFLFAAIAAIIFGLLLRRRQRVTPNG